MAVPLKQFIKQITDSGVMSKEDITSFVDSLAPAPADGEQLAKALVKGKKLTTFQAQRIYQGKYKGLTLGNYIILDRIGAGGMGQVYLAEHRRMGRKVALKTLPEAVAKDSQTIQRFHREVRAAAKLTHPNVVTAFDADEADGIHYFVMEYVQGVDLSQLVKQRGTLSLQHALEYVLQTARGLEFAHNQGITHRDIKPANLLLDKSGTVKILDMGLARLDADENDHQGTELTSTGTLMGTMDYMSPEQALDTKTADARSDIYSLGCVLHYLLTGRVVYGGDTVLKKVLAHRDQPIPSLIERRSDIPVDVDGIFQKMLAKDVNNRYQSMTEVIEAISACGVLEFEASSTHRPGSTSTLPPTDPNIQSFLAGLEMAETPTVVQPSAEPKVSPVETETLPSGVLRETLIGGIGEQKQPERRKSKLDKKLWLIGGVLGAVILLGVIVIKIKSPGGKETRVEVPEGSSVKINNAGNVEVTLPAKPANSTAQLNRAVDWLLRTKAIVHVNGHPDALQDFSEYVRLGQPVTSIELNGNLSVNDADLNHIAQIQSLQVLRLSDVSISDTGLARLKGMPNLHSVSLSGTNITSESFDTFLSWPAIKTLHLKSVDFNSEMLAKLVNDAKLTSLNLWQSNLTDAGVETISRSEALQQLNVEQCTNLTDACGSHLVNMPDLWFLDCKDCNLGDNFVRELVGSKLSVLKLDRTYITEESIKYFQQLPSLRELELIDCAISEKAITAFAEQNPQIKITTSYGVLNNTPTMLTEKNWALEFDGDGDFIGLPLSYDGTFPLTIELTCTIPDWPDKTQQELMGNTNGAGIGLGLTTTGFYWESHQGTDYAKLLVNADEGFLKRPVQVAATFHNGILNLFLDGKWKGEYKLTSPFNPCALNFTIGASPGDDGPSDGFYEFKGVIDEVHVSSSIRYTEDYSPQLRLNVEDDTIALYHFDEAEGSVLKDSSGNGHHGKIVGANWVRVNDELNVIEDAALKSSTHTWPQNQPAPAIAPFNAEEAQQHQEAWAKHLGVPVEMENSIGMKFRVIPPGEFLMGSSVEEIEAIKQLIPTLDNEKINGLANEQPQHRVVLTSPILMGVHEVTVDQFGRFVAETDYKTTAETDGQGGYILIQDRNEFSQSTKHTWNGTVGFSQTGNHPVILLTAVDAEAFCKWLSTRENTVYRLPTEAEWEFACRSGTRIRFPVSEGLESFQIAVNQHAWSAENSDLQTHEVGMLQPNEFGLYDMLGNAYEHVLDVPYKYSSTLQINPLYISKTDVESPLGRGGAFASPVIWLRSAIRPIRRKMKVPPYSDHGFRVVRTFETNIGNGAAVVAPDRRSALAVLTAGGGVTIHQGTDELVSLVVDSPEKLPMEAFRLHAVGFTAESKLTSDVLAAIAGNPNLEILNFEGSPVPEDGFEMIDSLPRLRVLNIQETTVNDDQLRHLARLPHLERLKLTDTEVSDLGLKHLTSIESLQGLTLSGPSFSDEGVKTLASLPKLMQLALYGIQISEAGIATITSMEKLTDLTIAYTPVTAEGFSRIAQMSRLQFLDIRSTGADDATIKMLQKALPNCRIRWDGGTLEP